MESHQRRLNRTATESLIPVLWGEGEIRWKGGGVGLITAQRSRPGLKLIPLHLQRANPPVYSSSPLDSFDHFPFLFQSASGEPSATTAPSTTAAADATSSKPEKIEETKKVKEEDKEKGDNDGAVPLDKTVLDQFTADMLQGCLEVLTGMPGTVYKACDVLSAVAQRNGKEWKERTMMHILKQVFEQYFNGAL